MNDKEIIKKLKKIIKEFGDTYNFKRKATLREVIMNILAISPDPLRQKQIKKEKPIKVYKQPTGNKKDIIVGR